MSADDVAQFLRDRESGAEPPRGDWRETLASAHDLEVQTRAAAAAAVLATLGEVPAGPWRELAELVRYRIAVRRAPVEALAPELAEIEAAIAGSHDARLAARWRYLAAIVAYRLRALDDAERLITQAVVEIGDAPIRRWMLDTSGQILAARGAFAEARRTWTRLVADKQALGDRLGAAITLSHLAQLELDLGDSAAAIAHAARGREIGGEALVPVIGLRIDTLEMLAHLDAGQVRSARGFVPRLEAQLLAEPDPHPYRGAAALALATVVAADRSGDAARWLDVAERVYASSDHLAAVARLRADLAAPADRASAIAVAEAQFARDPWVTDAAVDTALLAARSARDAGSLTGELEALARAERAAILTNNAIALRRVDRYAEAHHPERLRESQLERFTGGTVAEHARTVRADASIIFADLVGFTPRSEQLDPEEVMHTVRCLFELSVPLLAAHRVQALSYRGDGLLACARGEGHEARALAFAREFTARAARVTQLRLGLGDSWGLDVRAGVAAGPAVFGVLGTLAKLEYVVNGFTPNFAARLQSLAQPNEVVCDMRVGAAAGVTGGRETVQLKGIAQAMDVHRIAISAY